jgi:hypothetical protein
MKNKKKKKMEPTELIDNFKLAKIPCQGCGKLITIAVPFNGCPFCSNCITPHSWTGNTEDFGYNES